MTIHSKILVHWTVPKDNSGEWLIRRRRSNETVNNYCKIYTEKGNVALMTKHLKSIMKLGLRFGEIQEDPWFDGKPKVLPAEQVCFTELRLSETAEEMHNNHNDRYGYLGIGIHRKFALKNFANPVFYVDRKDRLQLARRIEDLAGNLEKSDDGSSRQMIGRIVSHLKPMNTNKKDLYFGNYDDLEWRITLDDELKLMIDQGREPVPPNICKEHDGRYYLKFMFRHAKVSRLDYSKCIECIIFPHEETLYRCVDLLKRDKFFAGFEHNNMPILTTVNRIRHL